MGLVSHLVNKYSKGLAEVKRRGKAVRKNLGCVHVWRTAVDCQFLCSHILHNGIGALDPRTALGEVHHDKRVRSIMWKQRKSGVSSSKLQTSIGKTSRSIYRHD
jgi:hypothetical protein